MHFTTGRCLELLQNLQPMACVLDENMNNLQLQQHSDKKYFTAPIL